MSDPSPDDDPELIVSLPEGSLDDLFAGLEASLKDAPVGQNRRTANRTAQKRSRRRRPQARSSGAEPYERSLTSSSPSCGWPSRVFRCGW